MSAVAQGSGLPSLLTESYGNSFEVRPASIGYTGDGTGVIGRLPNRAEPGSVEWKTWDRREAYGVGTIWLDDCNPDCAEGSFHSYRGSVRADRPSAGHFTRMTVRFRYGSHRVTDIRVLQHMPPYYSWGIQKQTGFPRRAIGWRASGWARHRLALKVHMYGVHA